MKKLAVFGNPIAHSQSPFIHQHFAQQVDEQIDYRGILSPIDQFPELIEQFFQQQGVGCNVTLPFKVAAVDLCHRVSSAAKIAGAVNTLSLESGQIVGDNTDGIGLINDLSRQGVWLEGARVLLLGAGGAARGAVQPLLVAGVKQLVIANRTVKKAQLLAEQVEPWGKAAGVGYKDIPTGEYDVVINASSMGISNEVPPVAAELITGNTFCYDMMYSAQQTAFCNWAELAGAKASADGLGMLVGQAAQSFAIWTGKSVDIELTLSALREKLLRA